MITVGYDSTTIALPETMGNLDTPYQHYGHYRHYEHYPSAMLVLQSLLMFLEQRPIGAGHTRAVLKDTDGETQNRSNMCKTKLSSLVV